MSIIRYADQPETYRYRQSIGKAVGVEASTLLRLILEHATEELC